MSTASSIPGCSKLAIQAPNVRLLTNVRRSMAQVDQALVSTFRKLAGGAQPWPLFLFGPTGAGKTLAALSLCDHARTASYHTAEGLCDTTIELKYRPDELRDLWETIATKDLVVLDEIGIRGQASDFAYTTLKRLADAREMHAGRVAIYISNLPPREVATLYDDRICSRLLCGTRFELKGRDRRFPQ